MSEFRGDELLTNPCHPWERQLGESAQAFHAFVHYRDLGAERSLDKAWAEHVETCVRVSEGGQRSLKSAPGRWKEWAMKWSWVSRAQAWDDELDRYKRETQAQEVEEMEKRHAQLAKDTLTVLAFMVRVFGKRLQEKQLAEMGDNELAELVTKAIRSAPEIADLERKSRGMPTEINEQRGVYQVKHENERRAENLLEQFILRNPELADALLKDAGASGDSENDSERAVE